jgi:hypothetical protein
MRPAIAYFPRARLRSLRHCTTLAVTTLGLGAAAVAGADRFPPVLPLITLATGDGSEGMVLRGIEPGVEIRYSASGAGDINGDGLDDVVLSGASGASTFVVYGRADAFPPTFDLASLLPSQGGDGSAGFVLRQRGIIRYNVSSAGDVNGDGIDDLVVANPYASPHGGVAEGQAYVVFGRSAPFPLIFDLGSLSPRGGGDGSEGFVLVGDVCAHAGKSVAAAGDINGDGIGDLIIGSPGRSFFGCYYGANAGDAYVVFGRDTQQDGNFPAEIPLPSLFEDNGGDGSVGVVLRGAGLNDYAGYSVDAAGDVNGDGVGDVAVGAWFAPNQSYAGETFVVFGRDTSQGPFPAEIELAGLLPTNGGDGSAGFTIFGPQGYDRTGYSVSAAGDVNADGVDDMFVGALAADAGYVVFGRDTAQTGNFPAIFALGKLYPPNGDGTWGFVLKGTGEDDAGRSVSTAGDLNGDGISDLIVGARRADLGTRQSAGAAYVVFGRDTAVVGDFPPVLPLVALRPPIGDGSGGFAALGFVADDRVGELVNDAGDVKRRRRRRRADRSAGRGGRVLDVSPVRTRPDSADRLSASGRADRTGAPAMSGTYPCIGSVRAQRPQRVT